jgi:hypothetical protein
MFLRQDMPNVHKDFHGCMSFGLGFLADNYGPAEMEEYLRRVARNVYAPLIESLRTRGLQALYDHWNSVMTLEGADFELNLASYGALVLEVRKCPAIHHMKERGYPIAEHFCESTHIVNDEICRQAGYRASVEYDQASGRCIQRFWREAGE